MSHDFSKFMVHDFLKINVPRFFEIHSPRFFEIHSPRFFGIQCPTIFCDFGLFNSLAQAGGGGALLYDISLPKTYRPKLLESDMKISKREDQMFYFYLYLFFRV